MKAVPIRVYDKVNKRMTYLPQLLPVIVPGGACIGVFSTLQIVPQDVQVPKTPEQVHINPADYVIMFATGRKDRNNIPIYDGDIVHGGVHMDMGEDMPDFLVEKTGIVAWCEELAGWAVQIPSENSEHYELDFATSIKMGNVFETPQVLQAAAQTS